MEQRWIPVAERLPEDGTYLTTLDGELVGQEEPFTGMCGIENGKWDEDGCVIAWMPLPEPYRESEDSMERLTAKNDVGSHYFPKCFEKCGGLGASDKCENCENTISICEKLGAYEDAEEQGLLLRLPCKIGDTLYRVNKGAKEPVIMMRVIQLYIKQIHKDRTVMRIDAINDADMGESCYLPCDIGERIFLTREEAEAKLKEMEEKDGR